MAIAGMTYIYDDPLGAKVNIERITSDTTIDNNKNEIFINTDSGDVVATLGAGYQGHRLRLVNTGTSGNQAHIDPDGTENLMGVNSRFSLLDGEALIIAFDEIDNWF